MKKLASVATIIMLFAACQTEVKTNETSTAGTPIQGNWKLLTGTLIEKTDTTVTDYTKGKSFIKIITPDHFAFFSHDLNQGKDSATKDFAAGGGTYTIKDSSYTEHLEYCTGREWEGHDFPFTYSFSHDTLIIQGVERLDSIGVNRYNIERYVRVK